MIRNLPSHAARLPLPDESYSYIKNYDWDEGIAFMERVFNSDTMEQIEEPKEVSI